MEVNKIILGDCLKVMALMPAASVDTIITDPPYGLKFMGQKWDYNVPAVEVWIEALRVLKPGGTLLCFAGSRTQHRMAVNVEDAGFILKDCIMWLYGSGFPKATDISKQLDKAAGIERPKVPGGVHTDKTYSGGYTPGQAISDKPISDKPISSDAIIWDGYKTHGLKPAYEPIIVAMKANDGSYANNAMKHGVAGLNIDAGRIPFASDADKQSAVFGRGTDILGGNYVGAVHGTGETNIPPDDKGRYPANIILDEVAAAMLDDQSGQLKSGDAPKTRGASVFGNCYGDFKGNPICPDGRSSNIGGASRFFYCAKASKSERNEGCEELEEKVKDADYRQPTGNAMVDRIHGCGKKLNNHHPTVKPIELMEYLCKLTATPTGGIVLDPFIGSGTTALAAYRTGRDYIGIEKKPDYHQIAESRIKAEKDKLALFEK